MSRLIDGYQQNRILAFRGQDCAYACVRALLAPQEGLQVDYGEVVVLEDEILVDVEFFFARDGVDEVLKQHDLALDDFLNDVIDALVENAENDMWRYFPDQPRDGEVGDGL